MVSFDPGVMDTAMQRQIRETDPHIFNEVERFVAYKTNGNLIDPEIIANELIKNYITHWKAETLREKYLFQLLNSLVTVLSIFFVLN